MATIMCQNNRCQWNSGGMFCKADIVFHNGTGQCSEFWAKNGQPKTIVSIFNNHVTENPLANMSEIIDADFSIEDAI